MEGTRGVGRFVVFERESGEGVESERLVEMGEGGVGLLGEGEESFLEELFVTRVDIFRDPNREFVVGGGGGSGVLICFLKLATKCMKKSLVKSFPHPCTFTIRMMRKK